MKKTLSKKLMVWGVFIALLMMTSLTSCSRYVREGTYGGGCGVWYPKKFGAGKNW